MHDWQHSSPNRIAATATLVALLTGMALVSVAQPPVEEEEANTKGSVKKRIVIEDDGFTLPKSGAIPAGNPPDSKLDELTRAADEARTAPLKALFLSYVVPFDKMIEASGSTRVKPISYRREEWPKDQQAVSVVPLDSNNKPRDARVLQVSSIRGTEHFESMILAAVEELLKQPANAPVSSDNYDASEKLLSAALRFHDYARERQIRKGKSWDELADPLKARLREIRLEVFRSAIAKDDTARARDAANRLMAAYPKDASIAREVATARINEATRLLGSASHADHLRARALLDDFESRFPGSSDAVRQARTQLREMATAAFTRAGEKKGVGDLITARDELARAGALDPSIEGLREMQRELRTGYPILYVGVRQLPVNMSPATARLDSEKQAVELMFEGLLEEVPQANGAVTYRPGAAVELPSIMPSGREFQLRAFERDSTGRSGLDSQDVAGTIRLLGNRPDIWPAYPLPWIGGLPAPTSINAIRIPFALGHPDPRALFTFKILPTRWMSENGKDLSDVGFAEKPFGTGPFRLYATPPKTGGALREWVFVDNPAYSRWRDRTSLPRLREIRLVDVSKLDSVEAFRTGKLHLLPDISTSDIEKYSNTSAPGSRFEVVTATTNRRVHILAMNLRRSYLQNKSLRQGISMAIDREEILREVFRAGKPEFHRSMTGPYPPNSWCEPKVLGGSPPLMNRDLAVARLKTYLEGTAPKTDFELAYPSGDPKAEAVCQRIKSQIEKLTKDGPQGRSLTINLKELPTRELFVKVQDERPGGYDLAYVPFDYPDDWHPYGLGAALDPQAAGRGGRNWFGFLTADTKPDPDDLRLGQMLTELRGYRDVAGQLAPRAAEASKLFNECVPFVPLWQLDRHMVVSNNLKVFVNDTTNPVNPRVLNPTTLFQGVGWWRVE